MRFEEGKDYQVRQNGTLIGTVIGDEFIRSLGNKLLYRIDGEDIYTAGLNTQCIGEMDGLAGVAPSGDILFNLELD